MQLTPARICTRCGLVGNEEKVCSRCGTKFPSRQQKPALNTNGEPLEKNPCVTPPAFEGPLQPKATRSSEESLSESATLTSDCGEQTETLASIPPSKSFDEPHDSALAPIHHPIFWGQGRTLFGIFIVNTFFTLLTLGLYSFWGRVRIRQFLNI